jgi:pyridoxal phosphate enzyme (YggS family)
MENLSDNFDRDAIKENIAEIKSKIKAAAILSGREESDIHFLAATKTQSAEKIKCAIDNGINLIGENREVELTAKYDDLKDTGVTQHFIGHLQTNKVKKVVGKVSMIESVDSLHLAEAINKASLKQGIITDILIEVNIGMEESKSGIGAKDTEDLIREIAKLQNIRILGLMAIPPILPDEELNKVFKEMKNLFEDIKNKDIPNVKMEYLSMGMSDDYELAIKNGANIVRIGSKIFGKRYKN